jgi:hypothetical protein
MFKKICICFLQLPKDDEILSQKLREEARAIFLQRRGQQLLNNNELKVCMEVEFVSLYILCIGPTMYNSKPFRSKNITTISDYKERWKVGFIKWVINMKFHVQFHTFQHSEILYVL